MLALVGPLLRTSLRWPVWPRVYAHDACGSGGLGLAEAKISPSAASELWRFTACGGHDTFLQPSDAPIIRPEDPEAFSSTGMFALQQSRPE